MVRTLQSGHINWEVHYTEVVFVEGLFCTPRCLAFVSQEGFHFNSTSLHVIIACCKYKALHCIAFNLQVTLSITFYYLPSSLSPPPPPTASVHLPRIGHSTHNFNWYGTERLIRKYLASRGVPTYMYPHLTEFQSVTLNLV